MYPLNDVVEADELKDAVMDRAVQAVEAVGETRWHGPRTEA